MQKKKVGTKANKFGGKFPRAEREVKLIETVVGQYDQVEVEQITEFEHLPLSPKTQNGLKQFGYVKPTDIQREAILVALRSNDILGAAKTGSGKTLAFLIPVLECLWRERWTQLDGLGVLIITPTRELALQIFEVLKKVGSFHDFSAALVVGGNEVDYEKSRIARSNLIICTPGRILQHMDENASFTCDNLKMLAIGVDDMFLMLSVWRKTCPCLTVCERMQRTFADSAVSISVTTFTDSLVFGVGLVSAFPAIRVFCLFSLVSILTVFVFQLTFFGAILCYTGLRESKKLHCVAFTRVGGKVLDEADRILDLGFKSQLNAIVENLPPDRQTLLFSATQTKSVKQLARLSLKNPKYVSVHENDKFSTPSQLKQKFVICEEHEKLAMLWNFFKTHHNKKILVFMSSCRQVRFVHEVFRQMRPGCTIVALHGSMKHNKRLKIFAEFVRKQNVILLATDLAARGLDFPEVDIVVQLDCPADANEYIHRAGRTARCNQKGESLLVLTVFQRDRMITLLKESRVPIKESSLQLDDLFDFDKKIQALCAEDQQLKSFAQTGFQSIVRSVYFMSDKQLFSVEKLDLVKLANSMGLMIPPRLRFLQKKGFDLSSIYVKQNGVNNSLLEIDNDDHDVTPSDDWFTVTSRDAVPVRDLVTGSMAQENPQEMPAVKMNKKNKILSRAAIAKKLHKKQLNVNQKIVFDKEGNVIKAEKPIEPITTAEEDDTGLDIEAAKERMKLVDKEDRKKFRERIQLKHKVKKKKNKADVISGNSDGEYSDDDVDVELYQSDDAESVDLSWLPDPDKYYPPDPDSVEVKVEEKNINKKRKLSGVAKPTKIKVKKKVKNELALNEQEELALKLLS